jgi:hypothetical protein
MRTFSRPYSTWRVYVHRGIETLATVRQQDTTPNFGLRDSKPQPIALSPSLVHRFEQVRSVRGAAWPCFWIIQHQITGNGAIKDCNCARSRDNRQRRSLWVVRFKKPDPRGKSQSDISLLQRTNTTKKKKGIVHCTRTVQIMIAFYQRNAHVNFAPHAFALRKQRIDLFTYSMNRRSIRVPTYMFYINHCLSRASIRPYLRKKGI